MKKIFLIFIVISSFFACNSTAKNGTDAAPITEKPVIEAQTEPIFEKLAGNDFKAKLAAAKAPIILDVRTPSEVASGTLPNATVIDFYGANFKEDLNKLDKEKPVFVYCRSGNRSGQAANMMKEMGFKEVYDLIGGYGAFPQ